MQRAGVGVGSLYDYFPNKKAVALALLESIAMAIAEDSRQMFVEHGREPIEVSMPKVVRKIFFAYKRHKCVLIHLVSDVPALRSLAELYALDKLIYRMSLMYLQIYQGQYPEEDLETKHQFLNLVFTASLKHYLSESTPPMDEEEFLQRLSALILQVLMQAPSLAKPTVVPLRSA